MVQLSIVTPLFNKALFLSRAINSVLHQGFTNFEFIIVDDGSTDDGYECALKFCADERVRVVKKLNGGASSARNFGAALASSEFLVFLDADDELLPGALEEYSELINEFPKSVAFGLGFKINRSGNYTSKRQLLKGLDRQNVCYFEGVACGSTYLTSSSACVRKDTFLELGGFDESLTQREDPHLWVRLAMRGSISFSPRDLVIYHQEDEARVCATTPAVDEFADSIYLKEATLSGEVSGQDVEFVRAIISQNKETQSLQNLKAGSDCMAKACFKDARFKYSNSKINYVVILFLIHTRTGRVLPFLLDLRYKFLSLFGIRF
jgi:glycosyltransferase involved in cell wall biosynthesis